jgi:hypothetical protein
MGMKRILVVLGSFAIAATIALVGAGNAVANPGWCSTGPFGHIVFCWQPPWWGHHWDHRWDKRGDRWDKWDHRW